MPSQGGSWSLHPKKSMELSRQKKSQYDFFVGRSMTQLPCEDELHSFI